MGSAAIQETLVIAPHPDDESLGCGGTVKLISSAGGQVDTLYLTRGEMGLEPGAEVSQALRHDLGRRRSGEAEQACRSLGVRSVAFLDGRDGHLRAQPELSGAILGVLQSHRYASVFCPGPSESHADHAAAYALLRAALQQYANDIEVWLYEVWTPLEPNMVIPIDATIEVKMAAIRAHESQLAVMDYATAFRGLAQYRSLFCPTSRYAEAFFTCDRISLLEDEDLPWLGRQPSGLS